MNTPPEVSLGSFAANPEAERHRIARLPFLILHVQSSCNCRCVMCDIWKTTDGRGLHASELEAQLPSIRKLGVQSVVFSGGEPLLNPEFPSLCAMLRREDIRITLLTTGLLLRKYAKEVAESFHDVIVSLDGPERVHDAIRNVAGAYNLIRDGIASIRNLRPGVSIKARTTVQKRNYRFLCETVDASRALNFDGISFLAADLTSEAFNRPDGWPMARQNEVALSLADLPALEIEIGKLIEEYPEEIRSGFIAESANKLRRIVLHFRAHLGLERPASPACNAPWVSAVVEIDGSVRPCFFHKPFGNLNRTNLEDAVNGTRAAAFRAALDVPSNSVCNRCVCSLNYKSE